MPEDATTMPCHQQVYGIGVFVGGFMSVDPELEERRMIDTRPLSAPPPKLTFTTARQTDTFPAHGKASHTCTSG